VRLSIARAASLLLFTLLACTPAAAPRASETPGGVGGGSTAPAENTRTLVIAIKVEPVTLAARPNGATGVTVTTTRRLFNATLVQFDQQGLAQPYLAESRPELETSSWLIFPDGRMETTYRLRPNLVWHDGTPLTADDFAFASQVWATPELGLSGQAPINLIEETVAPDPQTVLIRWKRSYAQAAELAETFGPLPRHLLESPFQTANADTFSANPFWTQQFVGAGPFRLDGWAPGASIEASAFDRHVLGKPKIGRVRITFISDPNTALANLLAGEVHFAADDSIRFEQGLTLQKDWARETGARCSSNRTCGGRAMRSFGQRARPRVDSRTCGFVRRWRTQWTGTG